MVDTDQGGTFRQQKRVILGPSVGEALGPDQVIFRVTTATAVIPPAFNMVFVNVPSPSILTLPAANPTQEAIGSPGVNVMSQIQIQDTSGSASTHNITILPTAPDTIDGLPSISITSDYGTVILTPDPVLGNWRVSQ